MATVLALALMLPAGSHLIRPKPAAACAPTSIVASLDEYVGSASNAFYWAAEGQTRNVSILRGGHDCLSTKAEVSYQAVKVTADSGLDHDLPATETWTHLGEPSSPSDPNQISHTQVPFTAASDGPDEHENAAEIATFKLLRARAPNNPNATFRMIDPTQASVFIIDTDGATRFRLSHSAYSQSEGVTGASIPVVRAGSATAETIGYTIEPSATAPAATPGDDYTAAASGELTFNQNDRVKSIPVTLINDKLNEPTESFVVSLTGTQLATGEPTSATFSILDNEESIAPVSKFHHPKHRTRYDYDSKKSFFLREIHVFTSDQGGSGVMRAQWALRKKMQNGQCSWWTGSRFRRGPCAQKKWLRMKGRFDFYKYRIRELKPTAGTNVKNYTAFSRAIDGAGNVENTFKKGRNANTFTIAR